MIVYIKCEDNTVQWYNTLSEPGYYEEAYSYVPTVVYSLAIIVMNQLYRPLAVTLNDIGTY